MRNWSKAHISVALAQLVSPFKLVLISKEIAAGLISSLLGREVCWWSHGHKKNKGGVRDPSKATKHQLVAENLGGDSPVFLSPAYSYLFSPIWTPRDLWEGSLKGEWLRQDWELFGCVFVCSSAFIFKEEFRGLGPFAGLCTASNFFTSCSLSIYKCLILSVDHMLATHDQGEHAPSCDVYSLVTSLYLSV